jgi:acyl-CoA reductase-like NAD-dependent aldehyde dehydrogenase
VVTPEVALSIDGRSVRGESTFPVVNPATGDPFAEAPDCTEDQLNAAMEAALRAFPGWSSDDHLRRAGLHRAANVLEANVAELAPVLTAEMGRPLRPAADELRLAVRWLRHYAEVALPEPEVIQDDDRGLATVVHRPVGPVAAITPWNYPVLLAFYKLSPALRAGNTVVLKPSPYTPLTTLLLGQLLQEGLPPGVLNVVAGRDPLGELMTSHPVPRKITFTGSVATGRKVAAAAADDLKRVTLELGGNDAAIVLDDVDVPSIVPALFWSAFVNSGQLCCAVKRVYAAASRHDEIVEGLSAYASSVIVEDGMQPGAELGPLNNAAQRDRVRELVDDAVRNGAKVTTGGRAPHRPGFFYEPTILAGVADGTRIVDEEQFGPALPVIAFHHEEDAVARANASRYGLNGSVWSADPERAEVLARRLNVGTVGINVASVPEPHLPFGGVGWSGVGRENGRLGLLGFTEAQTVLVPRGGFS